MALETLEGITEIGGYKLSRDVTKPDNFIYTNNQDIHFRIQKGPIKENGLNGCQVDTLIETAKIMITGLNKQFPCRENSLALTKLDEALMWLRERKRDRESRGVEGTNQA